MLENFHTALRPAKSILLTAVLAAVAISAFLYNQEFFKKAAPTISCSDNSEHFRHVTRTETSAHQTAETNSTETDSCPNFDDVRTLMGDYQTLLTQFTKSFQTDEITDEQISILHKSVQEVQTKNKTLLRNCDFLRASNGQIVFPEIPQTLQRTKRIAESLTKA